MSLISLVLPPGQKNLSYQRLNLNRIKWDFFYWNVRHDEQQRILVFEDWVLDSIFDESCVVVSGGSLQARRRKSAHELLKVCARNH